MMSAMENTEPMCAPPPPLVMRKACRRMRFASSRVSMSAVLATIEVPDARANVFDVVGADHHVHRQHEAALEESVGDGEIAPQPEAGVLMHRLAAPLNDRPDTT